MSLLVSKVAWEAFSRGIEKTKVTPEATPLGVLVNFLVDMTDKAERRTSMKAVLGKDWHQSSIHFLPPKRYPDLIPIDITPDFYQPYAKAVEKLGFDPADFASQYLQRVAEGMGETVTYSVFEPHDPFEFLEGMGVPSDDPSNDFEKPPPRFPSP